MKQASAALRDLLLSDQFHMADLYTFTLLSGAVLRYTTADRDITWSGQVFTCRGPRINRSRAVWKTGLDVDDMSITVTPRASDLVDGLAFVDAIRAGVFDDARVLVERAFMAEYAYVSTGTVVIFTGRMGEIKADRLPIEMTINSDLVLLDTKMPRNIYQAGCSHVLYDAGCALTKADWASAGTILAGSTAKALLVGGTGKADHYFDQGSLIFTSGVNAGAVRNVKAWLSGAASISPPLPSAPAPGDTLTLYAGCDRTKETCVARFNNRLNFDGEPCIPVAETAI